MMAAGLANITAGFGRALRSWAQRRQGTDPLEVELHTRRIYILPTRAGMLFAMITFVMLLGEARLLPLVASRRGSHVAATGAPV